MTVRGATCSSINLILAIVLLLPAATAAVASNSPDPPPAQAINDAGDLVRTAMEVLNSSESFDEDAMVAAFRLSVYSPSQHGVLHGYSGPPGAFIRGASFFARTDGHSMADVSLGQDRCLTADFVAAITGVAAQDNYDAVGALRGTYSSYEHVKQGVRFEWKIHSGLAVIALVDQAPDGSCYRTLRLARHGPSQRDW